MSTERSRADRFEYRLHGVSPFLGGLGVIAAFLAGGVLFGVLGIIVAVPAVAMLKILAIHFLEPLMRDVLGASPVERLGDNP